MPSCIYLEEDRACRMEALYQCFYFFLWVFRLYLLSYWFLTDYLRFYFQYFVVQHLNGLVSI